MSYIVKDAYYGISGSPLLEKVTATIEYLDKNVIMYLSVEEIENCYEFYLSNNNIFDSLIKDEYDESIESLKITSYKGIDLYKLDDLVFKQDDESLLIKCLMIILKLDDFGTKKFIEEIKNKSLNDTIINKYNLKNLLYWFIQFIEMWYNSLKENSILWINMYY